MLVGFLLVCATVLAKDSGKDTCFPGYTLNPTTKKCDRNSAPCEVEGCDVCEESNPQQCKTCGSGYTLNPTTKKCDRNSAPCEVEGCDVCEESNPQQCKTCGSGYTLNPTTKKCDRNSAPCEVEGCDVCEESNPQQCKTCGSGYTLNPTTKKCDRNSAPCEVEGCDVCEESNPQQCKTCGSGYTLNPTTKKCDRNSAPCEVEGCDVCEESNPQQCKTCGSGYTLNPTTKKCDRNSAPCDTPNCKACDNPKTDNEICTECNDNNYLTPTSQCVSDCTTLKGYYGDDSGKKTCKRCNDACAECKGEGADKCTACPAGKMLQYTDADTPANGGTCMNQCSVSPANDGCAECGAQIGGTAYCSKCKNTQQAPLDGNCAANTRTRFCTTVSNGACTQCENNYFLKDGGCYQTNRQPGKQVCTQANGGKCQTCANGLAATDGNCAECHPTCATCSTAGTADKCKTCATGYYKENGSDTTTGLCKKCSEKISGCKQCVSSSGSSVICLESEVGTGGSVNKSGLSTGAIAGISVAVIVVVGGLVGFLCWWFLCRGKA